MNIWMLDPPTLNTAISALYISKGNVEKGIDIGPVSACCKSRDEDTLSVLEKWAFQNRHDQLLKFINWSMLIDGLSRGGYDDIRTHGAFANFIAKSTRYCKDFSIAPWYLSHYSKEDIRRDQSQIDYAKTHQAEQDIVRGHFPLSIETTFIVQFNALHFMHIWNTRKDYAHDEVKQLLYYIFDALYDYALLCCNKEVMWLYEMFDKYMEIGKG